MIRSAVRSRKSEASRHLETTMIPWCFILSKSIQLVYPLVILHSYSKWFINSWFTYSNWWCSSSLCNINVSLPESNLNSIPVSTSFSSWKSRPRFPSSMWLPGPPSGKRHGHRGSHELQPAVRGVCGRRIDRVSSWGLAVKHREIPPYYGCLYGFTRMILGLYWDIDGYTLW